MARWICFAEVELGQVEASARERAERRARQRFGDRCVRVQSVLSVEAQAAERVEARLRGQPERWERGR